SGNISQRSAQAQVWDAKDGNPISEPMKPSGWVESARFNPDGKLVVTASADHTARVWNATSGKPLREPIKHGDRVLSAQFSPDGRRIVTTSGSAEDLTVPIAWSTAGHPSYQAQV